MKINALVKFFKRCAAWCVMRSLEIQLHGQDQAMRDCLDAQTREHIAVSRTYTRKELAKARADYIALLPPGQRRTFKTA